MPKISIVTSTFNRSDRLLKAIESVQKQTFQDYEHIIVDDCSTDDTEKKVKALKDPKIVYIKLPENWGNDTRPKNTGIKAAKGEYVAMLDDDNQYRPDHLAVLLSEIEKSSVDIVYADRWLVDENDPSKNGVGISSEFSLALLLQRNYIDTSDILIRKEVLFKVGGFDERYRKYVDWNLWVRLAKYGCSFKHIPIIITEYHLHDSMKSKTVKDRLPGGVTSVPLGAATPINPEWKPVDLEIELPFLGQVREPKVAIFSLTYDRLELTKACFKSLYEMAGYNFDHFIVDNGSKDGTKDYLNELTPSGSCKKVSVIHNSDNKGISIASNQALDAIKEADYDIVVKYDNDCLSLSQGWLAKMVEIWKSYHKLALSCYVQGLKDNPGGAPRFDRGLIRGELIGATKHLGGICHFVDARAYQGWNWDEDSFLHGLQDTEMSQHLLKEGYEMGYLENFYVEHIYGTEGQHLRYPDYFSRRILEKQTKYENHR